MTKEGQRPRNNMSPSDDKMTSSYYMSCQEYVYGERNSVSSPVRDHFRRQNESSSSMSCSGCSHGRGEPSGKPSLEEVLKRLHALEQHVFMNREPTEVFVEEVDNEYIWNNNSFEEPAVFQTNFGKTVIKDEVMNKNKTNKNVFSDVENDKELDERIDKPGRSMNKFDDDVLEEDVIITKTVNHFDDHFFDGNEVTPNRPKVRNPSKYRCPPYTELYTTPKQKRTPKKKVDAKSTTPVPPPTFDVVHDFSILCLQHYVIDVEHRFYNLDLDREFWSALFGHTHNKWLDEAIRLLMERRFDSDRMVSIGERLCLVLLHTPTSWFLGGMWIRYLGNYDWIQWKSIFMTISSDGTFSKFVAWVTNHLDKINYWAQRNILRIPLDMKFIFETNVPQQSSEMGDYGVFVCMFMEQIVSGQPIRELTNPKNVALEFRQRMTKIYWGSCDCPM
uniref:Ubiquitin-like protease family profile domain-containing protein n=1 Tax=Lactuca sativa TaxID=4236 RepID=A0A9R1WQW4_LACSA|nr:hypothetical protein LSAT_V11C900500400 [Lactuca sativa]